MLATSSAGQPQAVITIVNTAQIDSPTTDPAPGDTTASATTVIQTADLAVIKSAPATIIAGVPFTATLDYANAGPATATNAMLDDLLPAGLTVLSTSPITTGPGLRWSLGDVAADASGRITLVLQAPTTALSGTVYVNQAAVSTTAPDRDRATTPAARHRAPRPAPTCR